MKKLGTRSEVVVRIPEKPKFQGLERLLKGECWWEDDLILERKGLTNGLLERAFSSYDIVTSMRRLYANNDDVIYAGLRSGEIRLDVLRAMIASIKVVADSHSDYLSQLIMEKVEREFERRFGIKYEDIMYFHLP